MSTGPLGVSPALFAAVTAAVSAQALKLGWDAVRRKPVRLLGAGGMPSAHSAMVAALATALALRQGVGATAFAVAAVFSVIVIYDAMGVRQTVGLQSRYLNRLQQRVPAGSGEPFPERVGHTPLEVAAGALWGVLWSWLVFG